MIPTYVPILVPIIILILYSSIFIVRGKQAAILETFGKPHKKARMPGLNIKMPWPITTVVGYEDLQIREICSNVDVKTADNVFVGIPVSVQYNTSADPEGSVRAFYELDNPESQMTSYILANVRETASSLELEDLYKNKTAIQQAVESELSEKFTSFGKEIRAVLVDEPSPSQSIQEAYNKVIASKRLKEAATNEAEADRIRLVGKAQAEAESKKLQGEGIAQMRREIADGMKDSMAAIREAAPKLSDPDVIEFLNTINRLDTITNAAAHGNTILIDLKESHEDIGKTLAAVKAGK